MRASSDGAIPAPYMAYLRIYEPLAAFPAAERSAWEDWLAGTPVPPTLADEQERSLRGLVAVPPIAVPEDEERFAYVLPSENGPLVCPWQSRLRSWLALTELRSVHGDTAVRLFWPQAVLDQADSSYDQWWAEDPEALPHILTCSWQIPIRWLVLFELSEGVLGGGADGAAPAVADSADTGAAVEAVDGSAGADAAGPATLRFVTPMAQARRRGARALRVLKRTIGAGPLVEAVETLGMWLEEFHPLSVVELDYGGLMGLLAARGALGADELFEGRVIDCSVRYVAEGLAALSAGDDAKVTAAYLRYRAKWDAVRLLGRAN